MDLPTKFIVTVDDDIFASELIDSMNERDDFILFKNDLDENNHLNYYNVVETKNDFTHWFLKKIGFKWHIVDFEYFKKYVSFFKNNGIW